MNAPFLPDCMMNAHPPGGSPVELRQEIAELMGVLAMRAEMIRSAALIADDAALAYGVRTAYAEIEAVIRSAAILEEVTRPERARRREARAEAQP